MKRFIIVFLIVIFILSACTQTEAVDQAATLISTIAPTTITMPTATPNLAATETAQWETERFLELLPETLEECKDNNVIRWDHFEKDFSLLREKEKLLEINSDRIEIYKMGILNIDPLKDKLPSAIDLGSVLAGIFEPNHLDNPVISCSYLELKDGVGVYLLGIVMKPTGSSETGIIHFAIDLEATKAFVQNSSDLWKSENDFEANYEKVVRGEYDWYDISLVIGDGGSNKNGIYKNVLKLFGGDENYDPMLNVLTYSWLDDQEARELLDHFEDKILATVGFAIMNF